MCLIYCCIVAVVLCRHAAVVDVGNGAITERLQFAFAAGKTTIFVLLRFSPVFPLLLFLAHRSLPVVAKP